jgi:methionyl-tRNA synthetase
MQLNISYTSFVRTTDDKHQAVVKALLARVWDTGDIYQDAYSGRYCVGCEEYKDDEDLDGDGNCLIHKTPCPHRNEVRAQPCS